MMNACSCDLSVMDTTMTRAGNVTCAHCAGYWIRDTRPLTLDTANAARMREFIEAGGVIALSCAAGGVVFVPAENAIAAPGRARLERCPDCQFAAGHGYACDCDGTGMLVYHACVQCGDTAMWAYDGDRKHMRCDLCGARWDAAHPGWIAQRIPAGVLAVAS